MDGSGSITTKNPFMDIKQTLIDEDAGWRELGEKGVDLVFAGYYMNEDGDWEHVRKYVRHVDPECRITDDEKKALIKASYSAARDYAKLHDRTGHFGVYYAVWSADHTRVIAGQYAIFPEA